MKSISILFVFLIVYFKLYSQDINIKDNDSLQLKITKTFFTNTSNRIFTKSVPFKLQYDFENQYPFYDVNIRKIGVYNNILINFSILPKIGYVYLFTSDNENNLRLMKIVNCDSAYHTGIKINRLKKNKIETICIWYTKKEIDEIDLVLKSLTMTNGSFVKRVVYFLNSKLHLPNKYWNFTKRFIGFKYNINDNNSGKIIPIIINFN